MIAREVIDLCSHALFHNDFASEVDAYGVLNRSGEALVSMHSWTWLLRPPTSLDLVASQYWVDLPTDFAEIVAPPTCTGLSTNSLELVSVQRILEARNGLTAITPAAFRGAIVYTAGTTTVPPTARIELDQAPSADAADAITLFYRAGWVPLAAETDLVPIPSWIEQLYIQVVLAHALGMELPEEGNVEQRMESVLASRSFQTAKARDGRAQQSFGQMRGGAMTRFLVPSVPWNSTNTTVTPP